jgi:signal transduction histidine kinase
MGRTFRIKLRFRRFGRRHPWLTFALRSFMIFSVVFGGAYGFIAGSKTENSGYDPHAFAIGVAFLFAIACVALATFSVRLRLMRKKMRKVALHNEALADRNWELQEAEQRARRLFESQGDLIVLRDAEGRITYANDAYCELAQMPRDALIGTRFALDVLEQGETALEPNGTRVHDQQVAGPLGPRWIAWREGLVRNDAGGPAKCKASAATSPIAPKASARWPRPATRPMPASRAKSRFLAMASHEIRTPLNGIIGMSGPVDGYAADAGTDDLCQGGEDFRRRAALADRGAAGLFQDRGRQDRSRTPPVRASGHDRGHHRIAGAAREAKRIEIAAYVDERLPMQVIGDAARLRQVLLNLAGNAIKFTSTGGVALIVEPGIWPNEISFLVRDTGIGIAPEARERIFREFEQADDSIARSYGGTGLGLSISDRIVKRMGGRITLESQPAPARHSKCRSRSPPPTANRRPSPRPISPASRSCWSRHRASRPR